jgi:hypothetical protein
MEATGLVQPDKRWLLTKENGRSGLLFVLPFHPYLHSSIYINNCLWRTVSAGTLSVKMLENPSQNDFMKKRNLLFHEIIQGE